MAVWSSGMIPTSGAGGPGFDSRNSPTAPTCKCERLFLGICKMRMCQGRERFFTFHKLWEFYFVSQYSSTHDSDMPLPGPTPSRENWLIYWAGTLTHWVDTCWESLVCFSNTHRGDRTHDHQVKSLTLYRLS